MQFWFAYTTATGAIFWQPMLAASNPWPNPPASLTVVGFDQSTASADVQGAYLNPSRYLMQGSPVEPVCQPYLTASYASGTLTVTVQNPPATPPTEATLTVGATTQTITLANNTGTLALAVHASLAGYSLPAQVTAEGCVSASVDLGTTGQGAPVALQVATVDGTATVAPVGAESKAFLRQHYAPNTAEALAGLNIAAAPVAHILVTKVIPALQAATYTPLVLTAQEQAALTAWGNSFAPVLTPLSDTVDSSGNPIEPLAEAIALAPTVAANMQSYAADLANLPGLA